MKPDRALQTAIESPPGPPAVGPGRRMRMATKVRWFLGIACGLVALYFGIGACVLHFGLESLLLPRTAARASLAPLRALDHGGELWVRRYGKARLGCVMFFPGRHGNLPGYERSLFPAFTARGIAVLAVAYPGQDGAPGAPRLSHLEGIYEHAFPAASMACRGHPVVLYGRSLGAMVASYSAADHRPAGLILEGAAPSLSSAVKAHLASHWYSAPWAALPVPLLLPRDFSLAQALSPGRTTPVVCFQGAADAETPLSALQGEPGLEGLHIVVVPGGTHASTYAVAENRIVEEAVSMLRQ